MILSLVPLHSVQYPAVSESDSSVFSVCAKIHLLRSATAHAAAASAGDGSTWSRTTTTFFTGCCELPEGFLFSFSFFIPEFFSTTFGFFGLVFCGPSAQAALTLNPPSKLSSTVTTEHD